jgi:phospholipase/carboxylesterase
LIGSPDQIDKKVVMNKDEIISLNNWVMRIRHPAGNGPFPVLLLLHGWTGDENSMWVFVSRMPENSLIIAPRGCYPTKAMGYSWHPEINKPWPWINDFQPTVARLFAEISSRNFPEGDFSALHLVGFSQGAALVYAMAILQPERIASLAGLSGFLPDGAASRLDPERLQGLPIFIAHGTQDDRVPIELARKGVQALEGAGANVTYCEDTVGHKLSAKCFRGLEAFLKKHVTSTHEVEL